MPGLLQTEEYARALFTGHCPPLADDIIDQHVEARLSRQSLLTRAPIAELSFIIGEASLRESVGGRKVMRGQLEQLLLFGSLRNVEVQVMPTGRGFHPGLNGPFILVETLEHRHVGYVESQGIGAAVSDSNKVSGLGLRYGKLRSQALNAEESARVIQRLAGEA